MGLADLFDCQDTGIESKDAGKTYAVEGTPTVWKLISIGIKYKKIIASIYSYEAFEAFDIYLV
jgi:hypothetical protein